MGVDVITPGNHVYRHREVYDFLDATDRVIRPANYMTGNPGTGPHDRRGRRACASA